jgi:hypothetical protein
MTRGKRKKEKKLMMMMMMIGKWVYLSSLLLLPKSQEA